LTVSANYSTPVQVNGYTCKNCTDVDYAKKHIDPAHPKAGPYGVNAANDPSLANKPDANKPNTGVIFGGALKGLDVATSPTTATGPGTNLDVSV
jgi:hypothetical protein